MSNGLLISDTERNMSSEPVVTPPQIPTPVPTLVPTLVQVLPPPPAVKALKEGDAIDIWISRWLRIRVTDIRRRYGCDSRRLYEVWEQTKFPAARAKAEVLFRQRYPTIVDRIDYGAHVRVSKEDSPDQLGLFE
jgi:hypothetical protein